MLLTVAVIGPAHALKGEVEQAVTTLVGHYRATMSVVERYFADGPADQAG